MAAPHDQRIAVPVDDPNADTEWNDILRQHGIIPEKPPSPTQFIEEAVHEARQIAHENRLEGKDLDELAELEDDEEEEFLETYRRKRIMELQKLHESSKFGSVLPISKPEYAREITEASEHGPILVHLTSTTSGNVESRILADLWRQAAREFPEVKFCEMRASQAIEGYPEQNCPTILVYHKGDIVKQVVTLAQYGGVRMKLSAIDDLLVEVGAVEEKDTRVLKRRREAEENEDREIIKIIQTSKLNKSADDDDDEWD